MNTYIVNEPSKNIRNLARQSMTGHWKSAILAMILFFICVAVPTVIIMALFGGFSEEALMSEDLVAPGEGLGSIYSLLVTGAFTFGLSAYYLDLIRENRTDIGQIFSGFGFYFKTLLLYVVMGIFILLWTLLFIVPGIIATLRYSQAFYILADDPSKDIMQCLKESKQLMKGNKAKLFCLEFSFIGWYLLIYAVIMIASAASVSISIFAPGGASFVISMIILGVGIVAALIGIFVLMPYVMAATTIFYDMINGNLRPESDELPPLSQVNFDEAVTADNTEGKEIENITVELPEIKVDDNDDSVNVEKIDL